MRMAPRRLAHMAPPHILPSPGTPQRLHLGDPVDLVPRLHADPLRYLGGVELSLDPERLVGAHPGGGVELELGATPVVSRSLHLLHRERALGLVPPRVSAESASASLGHALALRDLSRRRSRRMRTPVTPEESLKSPPRLLLVERQQRRQRGSSQTRLGEPRDDRRD